MTKSSRQAARAERAGGGCEPVPVLAPVELASELLAERIIRVGGAGARQGERARYRTDLKLGSFLCLSSSR